MQQKMMKYMMVFMAFMFYKVPSGLGIYFITSSLWQIGERLLLPKVTPSTPIRRDDGGDDEEPRGAARRRWRRRGGPRRRQRCSAQASGQVRPVLGEDSRGSHEGPDLPQPDDGKQDARSPSDDRGKPRRTAGPSAVEASVNAGRLDPRIADAVLSCSTRPTRLRRSRARRGRGSAASCGSSGPRPGRSPWRALSPTRSPRRRLAPSAAEGPAAGGRPAAAAARGDRPLARPAHVHRASRWPRSTRSARRRWSSSCWPTCLARGARHAEPGRVHAPRVPLGTDRPDPGRGGARRDRRADPAQLDAALQQLAGGLAGPIAALRDRLLDVLPTSRRTSTSSMSPTSIPWAAPRWPTSWPEPPPRSPLWPTGSAAATGPRGTRGSCWSARPTPARAGCSMPCSARAGPRLAPRRDDPRLPLGPVRLRRTDRRAGRYRRRRTGHERHRAPAQDLCAPIRSAQADLLLACRSADIDGPRKRPQGSRPIALTSTSGPSATWPHRRG